MHPFSESVSHSIHSWRWEGGRGGGCPRCCCCPSWTRLTDSISRQTYHCMSWGGLYVPRPCTNYTFRERGRGGLVCSGTGPHSFLPLSLSLPSLLFLRHLIPIQPSALRSHIHFAACLAFHPAGLSLTYLLLMSPLPRPARPSPAPSPCSPLSWSREPSPSPSFLSLPPSKFLSFSPPVSVSVSRLVSLETHTCSE